MNPRGRIEEALNINQRIPKEPVPVLNRCFMYLRRISYKTIALS